MKNNKILVINGGSSSIKFQLLNADDYSVITTGICERIYVDGNFVIKYQDKKVEIQTPMSNHEQAIDYMIKYFIDHKIINGVSDIIGVGHRIVHGGKLMTESKIIDDLIIKQIDDVSKLAPLHNKPELEVIKVAMKFFNESTHVAVYDTSFHATIPSVNARYAIQKVWEEKYDVKRYGAHGTSHQYITIEMAKILKIPHPNLIVCHIGNGASICCVKQGKSYNTTMGLTPLEGLIMGTRSGDIDPSIVSYIANEAKIPHQEVTNQLNKQSGMLALTGFSDFRDITSRLNDPVVKEGFDMYIKRVSDYIVKYLNELEGKCDAIIFTAGVGENTPVIRQAIIDRIHLMKITIDNQQNNTAYEQYIKISTTQSPVAVYAMRTNEELMIAREVNRLISK